MEGRRVEGVFLDTAILRNKAYEAYETAKVYEIRILSKVPEALLASLGEPGSRFRANVKALSQGKVILLLENGYEVEAENRLSMPVKVGDELTLTLESKDPITLRVERAFSGIRGAQELLKSIAQLAGPILKEGSVRETIENSGLIYERRVWDFLRGALSLEELSSDEKYKVLKALENTNTAQIEKVLKGLKPVPELEEKLSQVMKLLQGVRKVEFFREVINLKNEVESLIGLKESRISLIRDTVSNLSRSFVSNLIEGARPLGLRLLLDGRVFSQMETNPRSVDVFREAVKSLESNHIREFIQKLSIVGVKVENPEVLPQIRDKLTSLMRNLTKGVVSALNSNLNTEKVQELIRELRELNEDIGRLSELRKSLSELPRELRENMSKLENIAYMQSYFVAQEGRRFVVPFRTDDGRGVLAFSARDVFRIFIKLSLEGGFLGVLMEAPKREKPEHVSILFKTDLESLEREIESSLHLLREELSGLGLEVKRLEVLKESPEVFEKEMAEELGREGIFNLRV